MHEKRRVKLNTPTCRLIYRSIVLREMRCKKALLAQSSPAWIINFLTEKYTDKNITCIEAIRSLQLQFPHRAMSPRQKMSKKSCSIKISIRGHLLFLLQAHFSIFLFSLEIYIFFSMFWSYYKEKINKNACSIPRQVLLGKVNVAMYFLKRRK